MLVNIFNIIRRYEKYIFYAIINLILNNNISLFFLKKNKRKKEKEK